VLRLRVVTEQSHKKFFVIDSSAVLAVIFGEPGGDVAQAEMADAMLSSVNMVEIWSVMVDRGRAGAEALALVERFDLKLVDFTLEQALAAGALRAQTRQAGLSLGDRACLALAQETGRTALTADSAWARVPGLDVRLIR
jgi:PIN domain nuclease of toxin-antitoxin system